MSRTRGAVGGLHRGGDEFVQLELVDGFVIHAVGRAEDGIGHAFTDFGGDGGGGALFGADDGLRHLVGAVGGVHRIGPCDDGRLVGFVGAAGSFGGLGVGGGVAYDGGDGRHVR